MIPIINLKTLANENISKAQWKEITHSRGWNPRPPALDKNKTTNKQKNFHMNKDYYSKNWWLTAIHWYCSWKIYGTNASDLENNEHTTAMTYWTKSDSEFMLFTVSQHSNFSSFIWLLHRNKVIKGYTFSVSEMNCIIESMTSIRDY